MQVNFNFDGVFCIVGSRRSMVLSTMCGGAVIATAAVVVAAVKVVPAVVMIATGVGCFFDLPGRRVHCLSNFFIGPFIPNEI